MYDSCQCHSVIISAAKSLYNYNIYMVYVVFTFIFFQGTHSLSKKVYRVSRAEHLLETLMQGLIFKDWFSFFSSLLDLTQMHWHQTVVHSVLFDMNVWLMAVSGFPELNHILIALKESFMQWLKNTSPPRWSIDFSK